MSRVAVTANFRGVAGIAQLVEHNLAKVGVAGSSPVSRSGARRFASRAGVRSQEAGIRGCQGVGLGRKRRAPLLAPSPDTPDPCLLTPDPCSFSARVAKPVDAGDLKSPGGNPMSVRVRPRAWRDAARGGATVAPPLIDVALRTVRDSSRRARCAPTAVARRCGGSPRTSPSPSVASDRSGAR